MPEAYPRRFGPFVLVMPLARGGMGHVALALAAPNGEACVVKRMLPELQRDTEHRARFAHEGTISLGLVHRNLVETVAAGEVDGEPYLAQRYLDGKTLAEVQTRLAADFATMPVAVAAYIAGEIASGLAYAHGIPGLDLVHRDISPPNIRIGTSGEVRLLDFGMASSAQKNFLTAPGGAWGKLIFMAPELFRGARADRRADIYALGVVLWEMLTGRAYGSTVKPDGGVVPASLAGWQAGPPDGWQAPPPSRLNPEVPPALDAVVGRALARAPQDRFASAEEFRAALTTATPAGPSGQADVAALLGRLFDLNHGTLLRRRAMDEARPLLAEVGAMGSPLVPATTGDAAGASAGAAGAVAGAGAAGASTLAAAAASAEAAVASAGAPAANAGAPVLAASAVAAALATGTAPTTASLDQSTAQLARGNLRPTLVAAALTAALAFTATGLVYSARDPSAASVSAPAGPPSPAPAAASGTSAAAPTPVTATDEPPAARPSAPAAPQPVAQPSATAAPPVAQPSATATAPPSSDPLHADPAVPSQPPTPAIPNTSATGNPNQPPATTHGPTHTGHTPNGPRPNRPPASVTTGAVPPARLLEQARRAFALDALDEALRLATAAAARGAGADAHALVGNVHLKRQALDEAERAYRAALGADPRHTIANERLARIRALREQRRAAGP